MKYDSPKTLRRRQQATENKATRPPRQRQPHKTFTEADWQSACEFHIGQIQEQIRVGHAEAAGRHAEALAHCAVTRRALDIMRTLGARSLTLGMIRVAKEELYDVEVAA